MPILAVECLSCGARLKIKAGLARTPTEIKCPKCGKMVPLSKAAAPPSSVVPTPAVAPPPLPVAAAEPENVPEDVPEDVPAESEPEATIPVAVPAAPVEPAPALRPVVVTPPPLPVTPPVEAAPSRTAPPSAPVLPPASAPPSSVFPATMPSGAYRKPAAPIVLSHLDEQHGALTLLVTCAACNWQTKVREELVGKKIRCKQCGAIISVTAPEDMPVAAAVAVGPVGPVAGAAPTGEPESAPVPLSATPVSVLVPVGAPTVPPPRPGSVTGSTVDTLVAEVAQVTTRLLQVEGQKNDAIRRAEAAEKAFQEVAGHRAIEERNTRRRLAELEAQVQAQSALLADLAAVTQADLEAASQRVSELQQRLSRLG